MAGCGRGGSDGSLLPFAALVAAAAPIVNAFLARLRRFE
jgi:hypothetical protein